MIELNEKRAEKEGRVTKKALITHLLKQIEQSEIESVVYVVKKNNGIITTGWNDVPQLEVLGLLAAGQADVIDHMRE